jgi:hypothetical protein
VQTDGAKAKVTQQQRYPLRVVAGGYEDDDALACELVQQERQVAVLCGKTIANVAI